MADEVEIVNFGEGGVASEATLASLVSAIEKLAASTGKDPKKEAGKLQELHNKATKTSIDLIDEFNEEEEKKIDATKRATSSINAFSSRLQGAAMGAVGSVLGSFTNFGKELIMGGSQLSDFTQHIPLIGEGLTVLTGFVDETMDAFRQMSSSGASFNNSLVEIRRAAVGSYMSLGDFTNFVINNSRELAAFGGTVTNGANQLVRLNKALGGQREQLLNMGFSYEEINENLLNYAYLTRQRGKLETRNAAEVAANAAEYAKTLQTLSKLTGEDVDAIRDRQAAQMNDLAFQQMLAGKTKEEQLRIEKLMQQADLAGPAAVNRLKEILLGLPPMTEETQAFVIASGNANRALEESARLVSDTTMSQEQFQRAINGNTAEMLAGMIEGANDMQSVLAVASRTGDGFGAQVLQNLQSAGIDLTKYLRLSGDELTRTIEADIAKAEADAARRDKLTQEAVQFEQSVRQTRQSIQENFLNSGVFEQFYSAAAGIAEYLGSDEVIGEMGRFVNSITQTGNEILADFQTLGLSATIEKWAAKGMEKLGEVLSNAFRPGGPLMNAIQDGIGLIIDGIGAAIRGLWESAPVVTALVGAIGTLFAAKKVVDIANGVRDLVGGGSSRGRTSVLPTSGRGARGAAGAAGVGAQIAALGRGIGAGLGGMAAGIITGIGTALAAMGPLAGPIALGAGAIGLAITAIGGGIAGATWLMGGALSKFAEGMASFQDLDGARLRSAASGITAMSAALVAFGAANVVSAIGNIAGDILNGLNSLFGGTTPFEKLEEFSGLNIDAVKIQQNARAIAAFGEAMSALGIGQVSSSFGNMLSNLFDGITSFFGGTTGIPIDKMNQFTSVSLNPVEFRKNADAVKAFAEAMGALSSAQLGASFKNMLSNLFDGLVSLFGGSTQLPYQQMIEFGKQPLDHEGIIANSDVLKAFGEALQSVPEIDAERAGGLFGAIAWVLTGSREMPWDKMKEFGKVKLDSTSIIANAEVLKAFGEALQTVPEINTERAGGLFGGIASIFAGGVQLPWDHLKAFGDVKGIDSEGVKANAASLSAFGTAMSTVPEINSERIGGIFGGFADIFAGKVQFPWDKVKDFASELLDPNENITPNSTAISNFATALNAMPEIDSQRVGGVLGAVTSFLIGSEVMPWDKVKEFGKELLDPDGKVLANIEVIKKFSEAITTMPQIPEGDRAGGVFGAVGDFFAGAEDPLAPIQKFGAYLLNATNINANMDAISSYSTAVSELPTLNPTSLTRSTNALISFSNKDWEDVVNFGNNITIPSTNILTNTSAIKSFANKINEIPEISTDIDGLIDDINLFTKSGGMGNNFNWSDIVTFGGRNFDGVLENTQAISNISTSISSIGTIDFSAILDDVQSVNLISENIASIGDIDLSSAVKNVESINTITSSLSDFSFDSVLGNVQVIKDIATSISLIGNVSFNDVLGNVQVIKDIATSISLIGNVSFSDVLANVSQIDDVANGILSGLSNVSFNDVLGNVQVIKDITTSIANLKPATSELTLKEDLISRLERVGGLGTGLGHTVESLQTLANVEGLELQFNTLKEGLDTDAVRTYNDAIETLIETIEELKESLSDVSTMQANANASMSNIQVSSQSTTEGLGRLGAALDALINEMRIANEYNKEINKNTKAITGNNVGTGYVSRMP